MYNKTVADPTSNLDEDNQLSACSQSYIPIHFTMYSFILVLKSIK